MGDNRSNNSNIDPLFWLPSEFLTDDDIVMGQHNHTLPSNRTNTQLPTEFPYDFNHDHNDFFTELTRQFSLSTLLHSNKLQHTSPPASQKKWGLSVSPQSILSPVLSNGSPNGPYQGPSSPTAPFGQNDESWNLICAAAGEVNMWKKMRNQTAFKSRALPTPPNYLTPFPSNKAIHVKQNNGSIWGHPYGVSAECDCVFNGNVRCGRAQRPLQSGWPSLQVHKQHFNANGSVCGPSLGFSGGRINVTGGVVGLKKKCVGTGVFLPRTCPDPIDSRVKPGCPASFTPPRAAAQALNVNSNNNVITHAQAQQIFMGGATPDLDAMLMRRNAVLAQQWRNGMNMMGNGAMNCNMLLPEEWSY